MARTYSQQKAGLTRALKKGPRAVLAECARTVEEWNTDPAFVAWPDDWHRWDNAHRDAKYALRREEAGL